MWLIIHQRLGQQLFSLIYWGLSSYQGGITLTDELWPLLPFTADLQQNDGRWGASIMHVQLLLNNRGFSLGWR